MCKFGLYRHLQSSIRIGLLLYSELTIILHCLYYIGISHPARDPAPRLSPLYPFTLHLIPMTGLVFRQHLLGLSHPEKPLQGGKQPEPSDVHPPAPLLASQLQLASSLRVQQWYHGAKMVSPCPGVMQMCLSPEQAKFTWPSP